MTVTMQTINEAAQSVMDNAAVVASAYSAIAPQPQMPSLPSAQYVRKWNEYPVVISAGSLLGYYYIVEPTPYFSYQFDQQTNIAILECQDAQARAKETESEFNKLVTEWRSDRKATSSSTALAMHPAYQLIIGMGEKALPFIFADLQRGIDHWFWALRAITRENPIPPESRGNMQEMANAWLNWGRDKGYVPH
jgi:hypothetical protein